MTSPRKSKPKTSRMFRSNEDFEEHVITTLQSQDRMLERLEEKLEKPVLNGGFDEMVAKVSKIEMVTEKLQESQVGSIKKIEEIHTVVMDPDTGLYHKVKEHTKWIAHAGNGMRWFTGLLVAGLLTGAGKLLYDFLSGHIHITP